MSLGWKIATWITMAITILGTIGNMGKDDFTSVLVIGILIVSICIKCLELAKELENIKTKPKQKKDNSISLN
jgi:hypothetical protein